MAEPGRIPARPPAEEDPRDPRPLRAALGNAAMWGAGWALLWVLVVTVFTLLGALGLVAGPSPAEAMWAVLRFGVPFAVFGFLAGGAFSGLVRLVYRGRRLRELSAVKFGVGGGILTGFLVPTLLQLFNVLSGDGPVPMDLVLDDAVLTAVFGGTAAGVSLALAKRADRLLGDGGGPSALPEGDSAE